VSFLYGVGNDKSGILGMSGNLSVIIDKSGIFNSGNSGNSGRLSEHEYKNGKENAIKVNLFISYFLIKIV
jgi:hypothetical protein